MKKHFIIFFFLVSCMSKHNVAQTIYGPMGEKFTQRLIVDKLSDPWEVTYGPDNNLWVTEAKGYRVLRINPQTREKTVLLDINNKREFPRYDNLGWESGGKPWPQSGMMGMALHPKLLEGKPYVYLIYVYHFNGSNAKGDGCLVNYGGCIFQARIVRYNYDATIKKLTDPVILCDSIPQSNDHDGGRLTIAPVNGKEYLFYTVGDMGAGQFDNAGRPNHAQNKDYYEGKILRFNTEPDHDKDKYDQWIPNDNPFNKAGKQNAVWTLGHRNPQGIEYGVINGTGHLYSCEHGPFSDDEVNIIEKGKNYGHPLIIGFADGNYDGLAAGVTEHRSLPGKWHTSYPLIVSEKENLKMIGAENYRDPLISLYPNSNAFLKKLYEDQSHGDDNGEWPSEAPSSIAVYTSDAIPGWKNSLLLSTLKGGKLIRLKLNNDGSKIVSDTINYFKNRLRYRDVAVSTGGDKIYLAVDSTVMTSGPSRRNPHQISCKGCIIEFTYTGNTNDKPAATKNAPAEKMDKKRK